APSYTFSLSPPHPPPRPPPFPYTTLFRSWLPFWARRMDEQAVYVGGTAPLKHPPSEYLTGGRFFCSIERQEDEDMFNTVTQYLRSEEHTSELQSPYDLVCRLLLEKKKYTTSSRRYGAGSGSGDIRTLTAHLLDTRQGLPQAGDQDGLVLLQ